MIQTCATCRWGDFEMTSHTKPRPKNQAGRCLWPAPPPIPMPLSITGWGDAVNMKRRMAIWPKYDNCPTWEEKPINK